MTVKSQQDLLGLMRIGRVVGLTLQELKAAVHPGMTTAELDALCEAILARSGATPSPRKVYKFPGAACISLNDEAAHGIPSKRIIQDGDLVKIDLTAELGGYMADACVTVPMPGVSAEKKRLVDCAEAALKQAIGAAKAGQPLNAIGRAVEDEVRRHKGLNVVHQLNGHGVGRTIHEEPSVPNIYLKRFRQPLRNGMVLAVEPHITLGAGDIFQADDGWTLKTDDGAAVANFEHTIVVTDGEALLVTAV